jgi:hypothetical protein
MELDGHDDQTPLNDALDFVIPTLSIYTDTVLANLLPIQHRKM